MDELKRTISRRSKQGVVAGAIILSVLLIDQIVKIAVKTGMYMHESIKVFDWFYIFFTENPGMAFGWEFFDKMFLTSFRIIAVIAISWYLYRSIRRGCPMGFIACLSLIIAGAAGNIIDCVCYGLIFNNPPAPLTAEFVSIGNGYAPAFYGKVVDMFYFPIIDSFYPEWIPFVGGEHFIFFSPIFNVADAAISCGIVALLLFYHKRISE